ncbi:Protein MAINTENANCE OF MERISTEMS, partial [Linum perenne]
RLPNGATTEVITYHARAYTWVLVAGVLLADRNGDHIQVHLLQLIGDPRVASTYSWGSAVLAWLYKVMGRVAFFSAGSMRGTGDIGGFTLLVELWALERFARIIERYIQAPPPPEVDTFPRGARWCLPLSDINIGWPCTWRIYVTHSTCVWILWLGFLPFYLCKFEQFFFVFPYNNNVVPSVISGCRTQTALRILRWMEMYCGGPLHPYCA